LGGSESRDLGQDVSASLVGRIDLHKVPTVFSGQSFANNGLSDSRGTVEENSFLLRSSSFPGFEPLDNLFKCRLVSSYLS
jgi:hypothetical protein